MKPSLQLRLSQHLALTPQLQQSIRLLQLSTLELNAEVERILQENPLLEKEETGPDAQLDYEQRNPMAFAATEEVPYDSSGRIVFPPMMRRKGKLEDLALFLGAGETFQVWNPTQLLGDARVPEDLKDIARFRLEERGLSA